MAEIKNDFINNMTHELKTPIATTSLALDAIANPLIKNDPQRWAAYHRILKEEKDKLAHHVDRVLQMAMLDKGELYLDKKPVDIITLLHQVVKDYQLQIQDKQALVTIQTELTTALVLADEGHLKSVFSNLLDNALKYSGRGTIVNIEISAYAQNFILLFNDNGIGIAVENQTKVFDTFYREQGGNLHDVKGFGLGLSYVKSVVQSHGGTISLVSEKGKGSCFTIQLKKHD